MSLRHPLCIYCRSPNDTIYSECKECLDCYESFDKYIQKIKECPICDKKLVATDDGGWCGNCKVELLTGTDQWEAKLCIHASGEWYYIEVGRREEQSSYDVYKTKYYYIETPFLYVREEIKKAYKYLHENMNNVGLLE